MSLRSPFAAAPSRASFRWREALVWLPLAAVTGGAMAWLAAVAEPMLRSPFVIFPLLVGACLGVLLVFLLRALQIGHRPTLLLGGAIAALAAIGGQHFLAYRTARLNLRRELEHAPFLAQAFPDDVPPEGLWEYLQWKARRGRPMFGQPRPGAWTWASWGLDGFLLLGATLLLVCSAAKQPYCRQCGSWFRIIRRGKLPTETGESLAAWIDAEMPAGARGVKFRMSSCLGGCGPTGLALFWEHSGRDFTSGTVWLDAAGRDRATASLDALAALALAASVDPASSTNAADSSAVEPTSVSSPLADESSHESK